MTSFPRSSLDALELTLGPFRLALPSADPIQYYETLVAGLYSSLRVRPGDVVLDLGANVGDFTILAARVVGPSGRVIAVEPSRYWRSFLEWNLQLNQISNVSVVPLAVGATQSQISIPSAKLNIRDPKVNRLTSETVKADTCDNILFSVGGPRVSAAKIDIEGVELEALTGQKFLSDVREIAIETHSSELFHGVQNLLAQEGFQCTFATMAQVLRNTMTSLLAHPWQISRSELLTRGLGTRRLARAVGRRGGLEVADKSQTALRVLFGRRGSEGRKQSADSPCSPKVGTV